MQPSTTHYAATHYHAAIRHPPHSHPLPDSHSPPAMHATIHHPPSHHVAIRLLVMPSHCLPPELPHHLPTTPPCRQPTIRVITPLAIRATMPATHHPGKHTACHLRHAICPPYRLPSTPSETVLVAPVVPRPPKPVAPASASSQ
nr:hypothetical protein Itr_chr12CG18350 [Ipomoea trifida]